MRAHAGGDVRPAAPVVLDSAGAGLAGGPHLSAPDARGRGAGARRGPARAGVRLRRGGGDEPADRRDQAQSADAGVPGAGVRSDGRRRAVGRARSAFVGAQGPQLGFLAAVVAGSGRGCVHGPLGGGAGAVPPAGGAGAWVAGGADDDFATGAAGVAAGGQTPSTSASAIELNEGTTRWASASRSAGMVRQTASVRQPAASARRRPAGGARPAERRVEERSRQRG